MTVGATIPSPAAAPAGRGPRGLPLGLQAVGPRFGDAALLAVARTIAPVIDTAPDLRRHEAAA